jgi:3-phenylpropionate/trans-cinnamate dioxygenase ferredoxin component
LTFVGRVPRALLEAGHVVRLSYPPFDVLVALVKGEPCAIEDACNHAGASLSEGERESDCIACPMHGYVFEIATGRLVRPRGLCSDQRLFVARLEGDDVTVWDPGSDVQILAP